MQQDTLPPRLRVIVYSAQKHEIRAFEHELHSTPPTLDLVFVPARLDGSTASLSAGARAVSLFATDHADTHILTRLREYGVQLVTLRYAGMSSVDVEKAKELGMHVVRAPIYPAHSVAEYTVALMMELNRKTRLGWQRVRNGDMNLNGLVGFDMAEKTVGIVGTGRVGCCVARILKGFGCKILAYDLREAREVLQVGGRYVSLGVLLESSDILTLHAPLLPATHHLINRETLAKCKKGVHLVNTARGGLVEVRAALEALQSGQLGGLAMDGYEGESSLFFQDHTGDVVDEDFQMLRALPNAIITGHLAGVTTSAVKQIAKSTIESLLTFAEQG